MMKRLVRYAAVLVSIIVSCAAVRAADLKNPNEIIAQSLKHIDSLESYSFTVWGKGIEKDLSDLEARTKNVKGDVADKYGKGMANKAADAPKDTGEPRKMGYHVSVKFMKPYLIQMKVDQSDYVPKIIYGSLMTYRPDNDPNVFWFKPKISPAAIKREVASESGTLLYSSMHMDFIMMELLAKDAKPVLKGTKKVDDLECYDVAFEFPGGKGIKKYDVDFGKWKEIPKEARPTVNKQAKSIFEKPVSSMHYLFDKKTLWLVGTEEYEPDGSLKYKKWWRDIKENHLSKKDF